jgi:hypothetical protein
MASIAELETERLLAQQRLDAQKTAAERNRLGQFATPPGLALEIARYVWQLWQPRADAVRFLDPALGTGAFYAALRQVFPSDRIEAASGIELDPVFADTASAVWQGSGLRVALGEFTKQELPRKSERYNLVLANPPYVRHHHIGRDEKRVLQRAVANRLGIAVSGLAGLYCYFLLLSDAWLAEGGLSAWLIPSEFMDVNYGRAVKRYLTEHVKLLQIHRFCPSDVQFSDALVSSAVVIFEKSLPPPRHLVRLTRGGTLLAPHAEQLVSLPTLRRSRKWTLFPETGTREAASGHNEIKLGDLFTIRRGLATGANDFFIRPRQEVATWGVPDAFVKPILPSPRRLRKQIVAAEPDGYPRLEEVLCLIDCDYPEEELRTRHPEFWSYLQSGKECGIDKGYLASRRSPWYKQEKRKPAPFLCTYMGRASKGRKPFRFLWNQSRALASNLYLMLYPKGPLQEALRADPGLFPAVFSALEQVDSSAFLQEGRVYGGALYKMEPKELARLSGELLLQAIGDSSQARQRSLFADA